MATTINAEKFWMWFLFHEKVFLNFDNLSYDEQDGWINELQQQLDKYRKKLFFSLNIIHGFHAELTISANGKMALLEDVASLIQLAPRIPQWQFTAFVRRSELVEMLTNFDTLLFPDDIYFTARKSNSGMRLFHLRLYIRNLASRDMNDVRHAAAYMLFMLLGEVRYMVSISSLSFAEIPEDAGRLRLYPLRELPDYVTSKGIMNCLLPVLFSDERQDL